MPWLLERDGTYCTGLGPGWHLPNTAQYRGSTLKEKRGKTSQQTLWLKQTLCQSPLELKRNNGSGSQLV